MTRVNAYQAIDFKNATDIILNRLGSNGPASMENLANELGISVRSKPMSGGRCGLIRYVDNVEEFEIEVRNDLAGFRRDFTIAHELAHFARHSALLIAGGVPHFDILFQGTRENPPAPFTDKHEREANELAIALMFPEPALEKARETEESEASFAARFGAPEILVKELFKSFGRSFSA